MAIYRSDQAQLTFAAEAAQGGDPEMAEGSVVSSSPATAVLNQSGGLPAGSRSVPVDGVSNTFVVGDFICIGTVNRSTATSTNQQSEIRRIEAMASAGGNTTNTFCILLMFGISEPTINTNGLSSSQTCLSLSVTKCGDVSPESTCTPSTTSTYVSSVGDSSINTTPSLPTLV